MENNSSDSEIYILEDIINNKQELRRMCKFLFNKIFEITSLDRNKIIIHITYLENFEKIFKDCERRNIEFVDNCFPPNENSLFKFKECRGHTNYENIMQNRNNNFRNSKNSVGLEMIRDKRWEKIKWLKIHDIYDSPSLLNTYIEPNEIKQGALKNSNFLSVLASLAEYPHRLKSLFLTTEINSFGLYGIKLCKDGEWQDIIVDDYLPCDLDKKVPCFSHGNSNSVWVEIIEKCYAKAYGSYKKLEDCSYENIMRDFTGAPILTLDNSSENLEVYIKEACEKQWIVTASAGETDASKDLLKEVGLIPIHSYSILEIIESQASKHNDHMLNSCSYNFSDLSNDYYLKIRNPWSKNEWIGDFSDIPSMAKEDHGKKFDGCFYMNMKDFKHYFSKIHIFKVFDDYLYNSLKLEQDIGSFCLIKFKIAEDLESPSFISILQRTINDDISNQVHYCTSRLILCKISTNVDNAEEIEYIGGKMGVDRELSDERILKQGDYLLYVELDCKTLCNKVYKKNQFVLSIYSMCNVDLVQVQKSEYQNILENIYKSCAKKENKVYKFINEGAPNCYKYSNVTPEGYAYIYLENLQKDATLIEDVKYTKFEGLELLMPFSGTSYSVKVDPGTSQIVLIRQTDVSGFNMIYSYHSNFLFSPERLLLLTKTKGKKTFRKDTKLNIDLDIIVYTYKYSLGLCFYYQNNTSERILEETLKIKGSGIEILNCEFSEDSNESKDSGLENLFTYSILINLDPGHKKMIELRAKKHNWSVQSSVSYRIESI